MHMAAGIRAAIAAGLLLTLSGAALAQGLSGAYLAGRHAAVNAEVDKAGEYFTRALARDPKNPVLLEQALIHQIAAGEVTAGLQIAERMAAYDPDHRLANLALSAQAFGERNYQAAAERIELAPEAFHPLVAALLRAWARHGLGESDTEAFAGLDDRAIFRIFGGYHQGLMRAADGDLDGAAEAFEKALEDLSAPTGRMALAYGAVLRRQGQSEKAQKLYEDAIGVSVGDAALEAALEDVIAGKDAELYVETPVEGAAEALYGLASALSRDGDERLSLFYTQLALYLSPDFDDAALLTAEIFEQREQFRLAISAYETIASDSPVSRAAEIGRAEALHELGEDDRAVEALKALTRREPSAIDAQLALGDLMRRLQRFEEGAVAYDAAIKLMSAKGRENWVLYYERGICYERSDQWEKAEADFFRALELRPDQPLVLNYLGYSWLDKGLKYEEALPLIKKAVEQRPEDGYIVDSLGWAYYLLGDFEAAVTELERAVELRPVDPVINDHLGDALWRVGRKIEAEFQWKRAMSFEPEDKDLVRIKRKLKVGLDKVLEEEQAAVETPEASAANDG